MLRNDSSGFLLMEVLLAVAIFSIALVALIQSQAASLRQNETALNLSLAAFVGYRHLEMLPDYQVDDNELSPEKFQIVRESRSLADNLEKILITVSWKEHGTKKELQIDTLRASY